MWHYHGIALIIHTKKIKYQPDKTIFFFFFDFVIQRFDLKSQHYEEKV